MTKIISLSDVELAAAEKGGKCLSDIYVSAKYKMLWQCKEGHIWKSSYTNIKHHGRWCPECAGNKKLSIKDAQNIAESMQGRCLSKLYINSSIPLIWQCKEGHTWKTSLSHIKNDNSWCPICVSNNQSINRALQDGIKIAKDIAKDNGGECLSNTYINNRSHLIWKCNKGHTWKAGLANIKNNNRWCPECGRINANKKSKYAYILYHWKTKEELICIASYEKKVVEYLNSNKIEYLWQPRAFTMPNGKKYYPDLYLVDKDMWIEIKGYFREHSKIKWKWFQKEYINSELWNKEKLVKLKIL